MGKTKSTKTLTKTPIPQALTRKRKRAEVQTRECIICCETKRLYRNFPAFTTCSHDPDTCLTWVAKQTVTLLEASRGVGWSASRCPQCDVPIPAEELQDTLPRALVKELKAMVDTTFDTTNDSWRWCLASSCGHGSLQNGRKEVIRCRKCDFKMCFKHQVPWHTGYTCLEYETSHPQAAITKTNEEMINKISKPCPGCGIAVEKSGGCNFIRCWRCGWTWQWESSSRSGGQHRPPPGVVFAPQYVHYRTVNHPAPAANPTSQTPPNYIMNTMIVSPQKQREELRRQGLDEVASLHAQAQASMPAGQVQQPAIPQAQPQAAPIMKPTPNTLVVGIEREREELGRLGFEDVPGARAQPQASMRAVQVQQPAAPQAQPQALRRTLQGSQDYLPLHHQDRAFVAYYTVEDGAFRYAPQPGSHSQTAIHSSGEGDGDRASMGPWSGELLEYLWSMLSEDWTV